MSSHSNEILQTRVKSPRPVRERHPTEKTMLCLLQQEGQLRQRFNRAWQNLPTIADAIKASLCPKEKEILRQEFLKAFNNGSAIAEEIIYVLNKINTPESLDRAKEISFSLQEERRRYSAVLFEPEPSSLFKGAEERVQGSPCVSLRSSLLKIPSNDASLKSKHSSRHSSSSQSTHSFISTSSKAAHYNREAVRLKIRKEVLEAEASAEMARQDFAFNEEELLLQQAKAKQKLLLAQARAQQEADLAQARAQQEADLAQARAQQEADLAQARAQQEAGLAQARAQQEADLAQARAQQEADLAQARAQQEADLAQARAQQEADLAQARAQQEADLAQARAQQEADLAQARAQQEADLAQARAQQEADLAQARAQQEADLAQARAQQEADLAQARAQQEADLAQARAQQEADLAQARAQQEADLAQARAQQEADLAQARAQQEADLAQARAQQEADLAQARAQQEADLAQARAQQEADLAQARAQQEADLAQARAQQEADLAQARAQQEADLAQARAQQEADLAQARAQQEADLAQARAQQEADLAQARAQQEAGLAQARAQREIELAMAEAKQDELQRDLDLLQVKRDTAQKIVRANVLAKALSQELTQENLSFLPTQEPTAKVSAHLQLESPVVRSHISFRHLEDRSPVPVFATSRPAHSSEVQQSTAGRVPSSLSESIPLLRPQRYHLSTWERKDDVFQQHPDVHSDWQGMAGSEPPHSSLHTKSILPSLKMKASEVLPGSNLLNPASPTIETRCVQPKNIDFVGPHHTPQMYPYTLESQLGSLLRNPRRDIRDKGVQKFTDRPDDYLLWKITFMRAIRDFKLEADEELSLLMAWLGPSSAEQVKRLYAAHVADPQRALSTAWSRLDQRFGASTDIEASLMDRLNRFPSLKMKDCKQLGDFSDLLLELASAKGNPELPGLACLDQHTSQSAILCKLPFPLREAWGKQVFKYKEENANVYPPFTFLVDFVTRAARERNDPQTGLLALYQDLKPEKTSKEDKAQGKDLRRNLSVKMTDTTPAASAQPVSNNTISCPIHQRPHSLAECREFSKKPYKERLQIVQKAKVCFRCCGATIHFSKDCKEKVKCQHCNSIKHCSAMHNFDSPQFKAKSNCVVEGFHGRDHRVVVCLSGCVAMFQPCFTIASPLATFSGTLDSMNRRMEWPWGALSAQ
ncbi:uncharacterized protein LOC134294564 [Anolis carolinensis]|uniref:uncharacterized protein LOC134294564 n=1 Tax=Anolis carolinensis TaxID=28377 RepID=UPI002F2B2418